MRIKGAPALPWRPQPDHFRPSQQMLPTAYACAYAGKQSIFAISPIDAEVLSAKFLCGAVGLGLSDSRDE